MNLFLYSVCTLQDIIKKLLCFENFMLYLESIVYGFLVL